MACARFLIAALLGIFVFAGMVPGAQAQSCSTTAEQCTEGAAYAACRSELASYIAGRAPTQFRNDRCEKKFATSTNVITSKFEYENRGSWISAIYKDYYFTRGCSTEPSYTGTGPWSTDRAARSGSLGCRNGCDGMWSSNVDGTKTWTGTGGICPEDQEGNCKAPAMASQGYFWNPILGVCEPPEGKCPGGGKPNSLGQCGPEPCPPGMVMQADGTCKNKDNECPAGMVKSPSGECLPGDGQCAQGEARGKDGTCKKDSDGDGEPDEEEEGGEEDPDDPDGKKKEEFSGGDDCKTPPSCSGSPIMCGQARIQWRIDCNTRKNRNIAGGMCTAAPICTGEKCDALEYSGLLMQWRTACATEKLAAQGNNGGTGQPDWTKVPGMSQDPGAGSSPDDTKVLRVHKLSVDDLDQSGLGGGGGCIGFATSGGGAMGSGFMEAMASPPAFFCNYIGFIKAIIILIASVTCVYILTSGGKS